MSENWTREHMVRVYGEAGADAMRKLSDAYAEIERLRAFVGELVPFNSDWTPHEPGDDGMCDVSCAIQRYWREVAATGDTATSRTERPS